MLLLKRPPYIARPRGRSTEPETWSPVPLKASVPVQGVTVQESGLFHTALCENIDYLLRSFSVDHMLYPFRARAGQAGAPGKEGQVRFWDTRLEGSNAGRFLMGAGNTLRWIEHGELRQRLDAVVDGIEACRAPSDLITEPYLIPSAQIASGVWGAANFKRSYHQILTLVSQPDLPARRLIVGETFTPSGNWSTYLPHKHEVENLPWEAFHEEMYFFKVNPVDGFGLCHYYNDQGEEENFTVRNNTLLMAPYGYHTVVSAPGYTTYYLWFLAGEGRIQATVDDPSLAWVSRTVPMLRDLGH